MRYFDEAVYADIRDIIEFIPCALKSTFGQLRCRTNVTPLHAAIFNESVPIDVVAHLLAKGANQADKIHVNGEACNVRKDMCGNIREERIVAVINLFKEYSL
jgi:hypothetical protein